jgi:hypothetical protein
MDRYPESNSEDDPEGIPYDCCYNKIMPISPDEIESTYITMRKYGVSQPPPLNHDGIWEGVYMHFSASIYFKFEGMWHSMQASE